jgi:hypothetical protein
MSAQEKKHQALSYRQAQQLQQLLQQPKLGELQNAAAVLVLGRQQEGHGAFDEDLHPAVVHGRSKEDGYLMLRIHFQGLRYLFYWCSI